MALGSIFVAYVYKPERRLRLAFIIAVNFLLGSFSLGSQLALAAVAGGETTVGNATEFRQAVYGKPLLFRDSDQGDSRLQPGSPAGNIGADAYRDSDGTRSARPGSVRIAGVVLKWLRGDKAANFHRVEPLVREAAAHGAQIVCTTECFLDGYAIADKSIPLEQYRALGEAIPEGAYFRKLADLAKELKIFLIAGMLEADAERRFNTAVIISPSGELIGKYHKQHLEHELVRNTAGHDSSVVEMLYGKLGVMICADRRLPDVVKGFSERGADFLICPSGGMFGPKNNDPIVQARSKENGKYIVFVHPAEFLVTGPDGTIVERTLLGNKLLIPPDQIGTAADTQRVCYFDLPLAPAKSPK